MITGKNRHYHAHSHFHGAISPSGNFGVNNMDEYWEGYASTRNGSWTPPFGRICEGDNERWPLNEDGTFTDGYMMTVRWLRRRVRQNDGN